MGAQARAALQKVPLLTDVNPDQQQKGLETDLVIDRATAARLGLTVARSTTRSMTRSASARSRRSTPRNQYHVVMEVAPEFWQNPDTLNQIYVSTAGGSVGGTQSTNALAGTVLGQGPGRK